MKYFISIFLLFYCSIFISAQTALQPQGAGTDTDPYRISSLEELYWIAENNNRWSFHYLQTQDIDAGPTEQWFWDPANETYRGWDPIGSDSVSFSGSYDGNGHFIEGLFILRPEDSFIGLFGNISQQALIKNLGIKEANIEGYRQTGILAGYIEYSYVYNCFTEGSVSGHMKIGGLIGNSLNSDISECHFTGVISGNWDAGGIAGYAKDTNIGNSSSIIDISGNNQFIGGVAGRIINTLITDGHVNGNISGSWNIGGITGYADASEIQNCYIHADISGLNFYIGGIAGFLSNTSLLNCHSAGEISGNGDLGGLAGHVSDSTFIANSYSRANITGGYYAGGLVGYSTGSAISNCYSTGTVSADQFNGGLIGYATNSNIQTSYWDIDSSGQTFSFGGEGRTTQEMTYPYANNTFTGWNFDTVWDNDINYTYNDGYPYLRWQSILLSPSALTYQNKADHVLLLWHAPARKMNFMKTALTGYNIYRDSVLIGSTDNFTTMFSDYNVETGTEYQYFVTAVYDYEESPSSNTITVLYLPFTYSVKLQSSPYGTAVLQGSGFYETDQTVHISSYIPSELSGNFLFVGWFGIHSEILDDSLAEETFFIMPEHDMVLAAVYEEITPVSVHPQGSGTSSDPFIISSLQELFWISEDPGRWAYHYVQTADIHAGPTDSWYWNIQSEHYMGWKPIGNSDHKFSGSYDANGFLIDGLYINRPETNFIGLFGYLSNQAIIKNLGIVNAHITGRDKTGILAGYSHNSTMSQCFSSGMVNGKFYTGGLIGELANSTLSNCYSIASVSGQFYLGGLAGHAHISSVSNSYSTGSVTGHGNLGGLLGHMAYTTLSGSYWNMDTSGQTSSAGGEGRTTEEMTYPYASNTYISWDFETIWASDPDYINDGYPFFFAQMEETYTVFLDTYPEDLEIELIGPGNYTAGTLVNIQAPAISDAYNFVKWTGTSDNISLLDDQFSPAASFYMPEHNVDLTAYYELMGHDRVPAVISLENPAVKGIWEWKYNPNKSNYLDENQVINADKATWTWNRLINDLTAQKIVAADISGNGIIEVVIHFNDNTLGYYSFSNGTWEIIILDCYDFDIARTSQNKSPEKVVFSIEHGVYLLDYGQGLTRLYQTPADILLAADIYRDGLDELMIGFAGLPNLYVYSFATAGHSVIARVKPSQMVTGDLTGDGHNELVCAFEGFGIYLFRYTAEKDHASIKTFEQYPIFDLINDVPKNHQWTSVNKGWQVQRITYADPVPGHKMATGDIAFDDSDELIVSLVGRTYYYSYLTKGWNTLIFAPMKTIIAGKFTGNDKDDLITCLSWQGNIYLRHSLSESWQLLVNSGDTNAMAPLE